MNTLFDFSGKVALVTGARTGLGRGMAIALAHVGADIAALKQVSQKWAPVLG